MAQVRVDGELLVERAENIVASLLQASRSGERIEVDLRPVGTASPGATSRIGNALRLLKLDGSRVSVRLPNLDRSFLDGQLLAIQIATHADQLSEGRTAASKTQIKRRLTEAANRSQPNALVHHDIRTNAVAASRTIGAFEALLRGWASEFPDNVESAVVQRVVPLAGALAEACWNVLDHSFKAPLSEDTEVSSSFGCRWLPLSSVVVAPEGFDYESDRVSNYMGAMLEHSRTSGLVGFLEVSVVDDGVGIAARQALSEDVYDQGAVDVEIRHFRDALARGGSVKLRSSDCAVDRTPGFGFTNVAAALWRSYGFASVRSGRSLAYYDGFVDEVEDEHRFDIRVVDRSRVVGTLVHLLVPLFSRGDRNKLREPHELRLL